MTYLLIFLIKAYQAVLRPFVGSHCRFYPTCSDYAISAILQFGATKGSYLMIRRLLRCHPWHPGGYDPIKTIQDKSL